MTQDNAYNKFFAHYQFSHFQTTIRKGYFLRETFKVGPNYIARSWQ